MRFNGLRHGQRARSFREAVVALGGDLADFERIIRESYGVPETSKELRQIERFAYENWLLEGEYTKTIFFSTDQSRNLL